MSAINDFAALVEATEVVQHVLRSVKVEPAHLLGDICGEYRKSGQSVPDHHLRLTGYLGEVALKALLSSGMISQQPGGKLSLYSYEPTPEGMAQFDKLEAEGFYEGR